MTRDLRTRAPAADDPRRDAWFMIPFLAGAMMLVAATAFADTNEPAAAATGDQPAVQAGQAVDPDCIVAGGETAEGMPATEHQEQVLREVDEEDTENLQAMEPAAGCPDVMEMPATQHQENVIEGYETGEEAE